MSRKRRSYPAELKAKVALEALREASREVEIKELRAKVCSLADFDTRRHEGPPLEDGRLDAAGLVNARRHAPAPPPVGVPEMPGARILCIATPLRISAGSRTALAERWE